MKKSHKNFLKIFGINFLNGNYDLVYNKIKNGGLMVVPAAPALIEIYKDKSYYDALLKSDYAILDSGFMVLILKYFKGVKIKKLSGVDFLRNYFSNYKLNDSLFLVEPSKHSSRINREFLIKYNILLLKENQYVAPMYKKGKVKDELLIKILELKRPKNILINIGGGIQEPLGLYLKDNLSYNPTILCTGAAIAILNGEQATIPKWVDSLYLGWLSRCIHSPKVFIPRYFKGFRLLPMLLKEKIDKESIK